MTSVEFDRGYQTVMAQLSALNKRLPTMTTSQRLVEQENLMSSMDRLFAQRVRDEMVGTKVDMFA